MEPTRRIYIDMPEWSRAIEVDDFVVAVGRLKSNSVYHVAQVRPVARPAQRAVRYHLQVYRSSLLDCICRGPEQQVITMRWHTRWT